MTRLPLLALLLLASDTDGINNAIVASPRSAEGPALSAVDEAARMLPLVTPYLVASTSPQGTHPARLFVFGDCRWLQPFVRLLPPIASVTMVSADSDWTYGPVLLGVAAPTALVMLVADTPEQLVASSKRLTALPELTRMLFWTAAFDYREFAAAANRLWALCVREALIATTFPDGVSRVFALDNFRCGLQGASVDELDVWPMAGTGWERSAVVADALFRPPCSAWRPLPPGEVPALIHFREDTSPCIKKIAVWLQDANARLIAVLSRTLPFQAVVECPERGQTAFMRAADCRLGAFFNSRPLPVFLFMHQALATFPWEMSALVVAVPARAGPRRGLLHPLTSEFSGDVWMATAAVLLAQWAALLALLPVDRDQATTGPRAPGRRGRLAHTGLQALAPLLGQYLSPGAGPRPHAVVISWFMTTLVLTAAYQGQLLSNLNVGSPFSEIDSLEELVQSGLTVTYLGAEHTTMLGLFPSSAHRRLRTIGDGDVTAMLRPVADWRNAALVLREDALPFLRPYLQQPARLHVFRLAETTSLSTVFVASKGSPFERLLVTVLGRLRAAGILDHWTTARRQDPSLQASEDGAEGQDSRRVLGWDEVRPVFVLFAAGLAAASAALAVEVSAKTDVRGIVFAVMARLLVVFMDLVFLIRRK